VNNSTSLELREPQAPRHPHEIVTHGHHRDDPWYWLREKESAETQAYLTAENEYADALMAPLEGLVAEVELQLRGQIPAVRTSAPARRGPYEWWSRTEEGWDYAQIWRRPVGLDVADPHEDPAAELLWDENILAEGTDYFQLHSSADRSGRYVAQMLDTEGDERYVLTILDTKTGQHLDDRLENVSPNIAWAPDASALLYLPLDEVRRPCAVRLHRLGTPTTDDIELFADPDRSHWVWVQESTQGRFAFIGSGSMDATAYEIIDFSSPTISALPLIEREPGVRTAVDHHGDNILALTNAGGAVNMRLVAFPAASIGTRQRVGTWDELIAHDDEIALDSLQVFADHLVLTERVNGLVGLRILPVDPTTSQRVGEGLHWRPDELVAWSLGIGSNDVYDASHVRVIMSNPAHPPTTVDVRLSDGERRVVHTHCVGGEFDPGQFVVERLWATASDGTRVPISLVRHRDVSPNEPQPTLLVGYGSYGAAYDAAFSEYRIALASRGVVCAHAHIRGGGEFGEAWWLDGKLDRKLNTFTDFIAAADHLVATKRTTPAQLGIRGGSAGGMLMGAVVNMRPDLFGCVVAQVPFVDCVTTVLDPDLPLSEMEWDEWGDPRTEKAYHYMLQYSPYDNVTSQAYPAMYVTGGLNDPRVSYWEPAKWVAKLRATRTSDNPLVLRINMGAGHFGASGRYGHLQEEARIHAFVLHQLGAVTS